MQSRISYLSITFEEHPTIVDQFEVRVVKTHKIARKSSGHSRRMFVTPARNSTQPNGPRIEAILAMILSQFPPVAEGIPALVPMPEQADRGY